MIPGQVGLGIVILGLRTAGPPSAHRRESLNPQASLALHHSGDRGCALHSPLPPSPSLEVS